MSCEIKSFLPKRATDDQEVCDRYGITWIFDAEKRTWVQKGKQDEALIVNEFQDGLITPEIYGLLSSIRSYEKSDLAPLKIAPHLDSSYYYFRSSDRKVKFKLMSRFSLRKR